MTARDIDAAQRQCDRFVARTADWRPRSVAKLDELLGHEAAAAFLVAQGTKCPSVEGVAELKRLPTSSGGVLPGHDRGPQRRRLFGPRGVRRQLVLGPPGADRSPGPCTTAWAPPASRSTLLLGYCSSATVAKPPGGAMSCASRSTRPRSSTWCWRPSR
jgi:hypothetical protein